MRLTQFYTPGCRCLPLLNTEVSSTHARCKSWHHGFNLQSVTPASAPDLVQIKDDKKLFYCLCFYSKVLAWDLSLLVAMTTPMARETYLMFQFILFLNWFSTAFLISVLCYETVWLFFGGVGLKPPLGPFFRSPRFRFLRSLYSSPLGPYKSQHCGHIGLLCIPRMIHEGDCGVIGDANDDCRGNRSIRRKPAPAPLCPTTNPTWPGPVSNPGP
jgi:hypothetical protein